MVYVDKAKEILESNSSKKYSEEDTKKILDVLYTFSNIILEDEE